MDYQLKRMDNLQQVVIIQDYLLFLKHPPVESNKKYNLIKVVEVLIGMLMA